ncbi:MAG TPA: sigma-70 family RNA polymerase sigma factor [Chthoniobacterales bacterium]
MENDREIWLQFSEGIRRFVSKRVPSSDVDDLVQDILMRANRSFMQLREKKRAEVWILAIARKAIADFYRKRERQGPVAHGEELPDSPDELAVQPENLSHYMGEHDVHEEVVSWLRPMADEIDEPYRTALIKSDFENVSQRQLARELGLSESGLKSRVQRARKHLADVLQRCCEVEFGDQGRAVAFRRLRTCPCER